MSRVEERDRAAVAVLGVLAADDGLEALHVQPVAVAVRRPSARRARRAARPGPLMNASRSRQSGHRSSRSSGPMRPISSVSCWCRRKPGWRSARRAARRRRSRRRGCGRSAAARRRRARRARASARSMLMIGVMPLPALMKRNLSGQRVGQREDALDAAEADDRARACASRTRCGETLPSGTSFGVMRDAAVGAARDRRSASRRASGGRRRRRSRCAGTGPARGPPTPSPA